MGLRPAGAPTGWLVDDGARLGGGAAARCRASAPRAGACAMADAGRAARRGGGAASGRDRGRAAQSAFGRLVRVKGVATTSASILLDEGLVWRAFRNRREIGGILGFAPTPYQSGDRSHEQGISHAGNHRLQAISVQLAWQWVRWQPDSPLTQWFHTRFAAGSGRLRRIGIVAVARRLLIALWHATAGGVPAGAILKAI